jgi:hypothetical protein
MATLLFIKSALVSIAVDGGTAIEFQGNLQDVHVEVTAGDVVDYPTLDGEVASNVGKETYALVMTGAQDYSADGLARFLWDNKSKVATVVVNAHGQTAIASDDTPAVEGTVTLVPVTYGGAVEEFAEFEVTLPFTAEPTLNIGTPAP